MQPMWLRFSYHWCYVEHTRTSIRRCLCQCSASARHSRLAEAEGWAEAWSSGRRLALELALDDSKDGVHAGAAVRSWQLQVLLNRYCAAAHADATCCRQTPPVAGAQLVLLLSLPVSYAVARLPSQRDCTLPLPLHRSTCSRAASFSRCSPGASFSAKSRRPMAHSPTARQLSRPRCHSTKARASNASRTRSQRSADWLLCSSTASSQTGSLPFETFSQILASLHNNAPPPFA